MNPTARRNLVEPVRQLLRLPERCLFPRRELTRFFTNRFGGVDLAEHGRVQGCRGGKRDEHQTVR